MKYLDKSFSVAMPVKGDWPWKEAVKQAMLELEQEGVERSVEHMKELDGLRGAEGVHQRGE